MLHKLFQKVLPQEAGAFGNNIEKNVDIIFLQIIFDRPAV